MLESPAPATTIVLARATIPATSNSGAYVTIGIQTLALALVDANPVETVMSVAEGRRGPGFCAHIAQRHVGITFT
ncbi:hypothetical protein RQCS_59350 (plasmid) [Rhodococcus qingshengii]|nr:hypothetical protein RQCS_59350 [Rhodococcus qingshengii]